MTEYEKELRGVLFKNDKDGNEARPDYTGTAQIKGVEYRMASWIKEAQSGKKFMSISFSLPQGQEHNGEQPAQDDSNVPF